MFRELTDVTVSIVSNSFVFVAREDDSIRYGTSLEIFYIRVSASHI